ncbi:MAG: UDP-glucose 4-epimerase [Verrucomicrobia bacterium CG_4_10_14_3_um_filter_43_23]|nr:MAG: UDP-glucose 4-epimerase [Verrucomicrobia bacterium CG_4_10_14_3_um_filter_43_23]
MTLAKEYPKIMITGGGGYVASALVPKLLSLGCKVAVLDLFLYGEDVLPSHPNLEKIKGDIRDIESVRKAAKGAQAIIHLACISNDPSFELNPELGKSINLDAFHNIIETVKEEKPKRFIYASSSSIYGIQDNPNVREDAPAKPLTDYSKFKLECEYILRKANLPAETIWTIIRPATVCGYANRLRLDLVVNVLTIHALVNKKIRLFGGSQLRPNIVIDDMVNAYISLLEAPGKLVHREAFNAGYHNFSLEQIAQLVRDTLGDRKIEIITEKSNDLRSYHINSDKIRERIGFEAKNGLEVAIKGLKEAYEKNLIESGLENPKYHNIKLMQQVKLQ